ncbi:MAG TPA: transglycosylase SLT domain-containing protein [Xanthobacteraceae bacterium]|nr:transglycosylase SLT domain-containing protein [Xanthobacteraceae bacterium]
MAGYSVTFSVVDNATRQIEAINQRMRQMRAPMERQSRAIREFVDVSGLRRVADGFTGIGRAGLAAFSSLTRLVPVMGALTGAASIAGLGRLVSTWSQFGANLQRDASRIGTTTQELERLRNAIVEGGGSANTMVQSLKDLTDASARAFTDPGHNQQTFARFQQAGISLQGLNGQLRSSTELMPEVLQFIDSWPNPTDRMRVATDLGGTSLYDLTEQLRMARRPGETLTDTWGRLNEKASQFAALTEQQKAGLQRYREAVGGMTVAFNELSKGIGTTLAIALTPLINKFSDWVARNQPEIQRAVDELATAFGQWLEGVNVDQLLADLSEVGRIIGRLVRAVGELIKIWERLHGTYRVTAADILAGSPLAAGLSAEEKARIVAEATPAGEAPPPVPQRSLYERLGLPRLGPAPVGAAPPRRPAAAAPAAPAGQPLQPIAGRVAPGALQTRLEDIIRDSPLAGMAPEDAARYGIKTGAPHEWAHLMTQLAGQESGFQAGVGNTSESERAVSGGAGSHGLFQLSPQDAINYGIQDKPFTLEQLQDPDFNARAAVQIAAKRIQQGGTIRKGLGAYWGPVKRGWTPSTAPVAAPGAGDFDRMVADQGLPSGVNPQLHESLVAGFNAALPPGYTAEVISGVRRGDTGSQHYTGSAEDWQITGPQGQKIPNRGEDVSGLYRQAGVQSLAYMMEKYPDLATRFAHGAHFETSRGSGEADIMHYDIGGPRGRIGDPLSEHREAAELLRQRRSMFAEAAGEPAEVTGGAPVSGSVDVTVTHKNPPAGATMTATAEGDGINLAPPRTEHQQLAAA